MKAEIQLIDNGTDKLVATYTINFVPGEPAQGTVLRVEGGDAATGSVQDGVYTDGTVAISPAPTIQSMNGIWGLKMGFNADYKISVPADFTIDEIRFVGAPVYGNCKIPYVITSHETTRTTAADSLYLSEENQTVAFKLLDYKAGDTLALTIDLWGEVINYIELTSVADKEVVATPSIYVEEGNVSDTITLTSDTENAIIYYTLDGTEPTTSSNRYTGRFMISGNCTIKAIATARVFNFEDSEVAEKVVDHFKTQGGFSFTFAPGDGTTVDLTGDPKYKYVRVSDLNPAFQIKGENTVYSDSRFKMAAGSEFAICVPANAIVTKLTFVNACDNYYNAETGANTDSEWDYIKSEGATVIVSDDMKITSAKNITASIQNHTAGTPILFRIKKCAQFACASIIVEYAQMNDDAVEYVGASVEEDAVLDASGSFTLSFDREVTLNEGARIQIDGESIRTVSNGTAVTGYYWELPYESTHTLTLPAAAVSDIFGNTYDEDITIRFSIGEKPVVEMSRFDYIVANVDELNAAIPQFQKVLHIVGQVALYPAQPGRCFGKRVYPVAVGYGDVQLFILPSDPQPPFAVDVYFINILQFGAMGVGGIGLQQLYVEVVPFVLRSQEHHAAIPAGHQDLAETVLLDGADRIGELHVLPYDVAVDREVAQQVHAGIVDSQSAVGRYGPDAVVTVPEE